MRADGLLTEAGWHPHLLGSPRPSHDAITLGKGRQNKLVQPALRLEVAEFMISGSLALVPRKPVVAFLAGDTVALNRDQHFLRR